MTSWVQVRVATDDEHAEQVEAVLGDLGAQAVTLEDGGDQPLLEPDPGATPLWQAVTVVGLFTGDADQDRIAATLARLDAGASPLTVHFEDLPDREWRRAWLEDWEPLAFGQRLWVAPFGAAVEADDAIVLRLDPGLAFGTGTHESTALCLEWLDRHAPRDEVVLDYGCGSGILAIAAILLGARAAHGVDIDPQALEATRANAAANAVADRIRVHEVDALPAGRYPVILANILAAPLIDLAPSLAGHQQAGDRVVLAGLLADQADAVCAAWRPWYDIDIGGERGSWVRLDGTRR